MNLRGIVKKNTPQNALFIFICSAFLFFLFVACEREEKTSPITILQNKVEIDLQLKELAKIFEEQSGIPLIVKSCGGDACATQTQLKAEFNAGTAPDIFTIEGISHYNTWKEYLLDLSGEEWVDDTDLEFSVDGVVYGFPVSVEGWGMAYNKDLLDRAGIDPVKLTNYEAYKEAFEKLDGMKAELGIDTVVSMVAASGIEWVTATHNFNSYLANGLARDDLSMVDLAMDGKVDEQRLEEYARWVKLLFDYSDPRVLSNGDYDSQIVPFATQKAVFIHQGNWIEPNLESAGANFERGFAPHGSMTKDTDGIFVSAPSWYAVNNGGNTEGAKKFLQFLASTDEGHDYTVNKILAISPFNSSPYIPKAPLSVSILEWVSAGKTYAWDQYYFPDSFRNQQIGPIYQQLAREEISTSEFIDLMTKEFVTLKE